MLVPGWVSLAAAGYPGRPVEVEELGALCNTANENPWAARGHVRPTLMITTAREVARLVRGQAQGKRSSGIRSRQRSPAWPAWTRLWLIGEGRWTIQMANHNWAFIKFLGGGHLHRSRPAASARRASTSDNGAGIRRESRKGCAAL